MTTFAYTYIDVSGKRRKGLIDAKGPAEARHELNAQKAVVLDLKEKSEGASAAARPSSTAARGKVTRRELIEFCIYLGTLSEAGLSLTASLSDFASEQQNDYLRYVVQAIEKTVESGGTVSDGMQLFPKVFSREFVYLIRAGEQTGTLPNAFKELRLYLQWLERLTADVKQATTYPAFISVALGFFVLYLFSSAVPKITGILIDMELELPLITRVIVVISSVAIHTWYLWILAAIAVPIAIKISIKRSESFALFIDEIKLRIPIFGNLIRLIIQARFTQNFAILYRAGISVIENLNLCIGFIGNRVYARSLKKTLQDIQEGGTLSESLKKSGLFTGLVIRMFSVGEATGGLDESLTFAAKYYDDEVPRRVKRVFGIIEPLIIIFLVGIIGMVALAIFLPILSISQGLSS